MARYVKFTKNNGDRHNITNTVASGETIICFIPQVKEARKLMLKTFAEITVSVTLADVPSFDWQANGSTVTDPLDATDWELCLPGSGYTYEFEQGTALKITNSTGSSVKIRGVI